MGARISYRELLLRQLKAHLGEPVHNDFGWWWMIRTGGDSRSITVAIVDHDAGAEVWTFDPRADVLHLVDRFQIDSEGQINEAVERIKQRLIQPQRGRSGD